MTLTQTETDGRHDFDFFFGRWRVRNRRLVNMVDPTCTEWFEFDAACEARPVLGGLGNVDTFSTTLEDGTTFEGMTLRLFRPEDGTWRIFWASTTVPGHLDPPVEGRFDGNRGEFYGEDVVFGVPVGVRFEWSHEGTDTARWQQEFSFDEGKSWQVNWVMDMTRVA